MLVKGECIHSGVCMILIGCRGEDVYDGCCTGFYVCECVEISLYVNSYENVDVFEGVSWYFV